MFSKAKEMTVKPNFWQNLITNGDFSNGTTGWSGYASVNTVGNNILANSPTGEETYGVALSTMANVNIGNKCYVRLRARATSAFCNKIRNLVVDDACFVDNPIQNEWYDFTFIRTATVVDNNIALYHFYADAPTANGKVMEAKEVMVINLTAIFGAGNEPSKEWCDINIAPYIIY